MAVPDPNDLDLSASIALQTEYAKLIVSEAVNLQMGCSPRDVLDRILAFKYQDVSGYFSDKSNEEFLQQTLSIDIPELCTLMTSLEKNLGEYLSYTPVPTQPPPTGQLIDTNEQSQSVAAQSYPDECGASQNLAAEDTASTASRSRSNHESSQEQNRQGVDEELVRRFGGVMKIEPASSQPPPPPPDSPDMVPIPVPQKKDPFVSRFASRVSKESDAPSQSVSPQQNNDDEEEMELEMIRLEAERVERLRAEAAAREAEKAALLAQQQEQQQNRQQEEAYQRQRADQERAIQEADGMPYTPPEGLDEQYQGRASFFSLVNPNNRFLCVEPSSTPDGRPEMIKCGGPLGVAFDEDRREWLITNSRENKLLWYPSMNEIASPSMRTPSALAILHPGSTAIVLCDNALRLYTYGGDGSNDKFHVLVENLNRSCRGLAVTNAGNLLTCRRFSGQYFVVCYSTDEFNKELCRVPLVGSGINPCFMDCVDNRLVITELGTQSCFLFYVTEEESHSNGMPTMKVEIREVRHYRPQKWNPEYDTEPSGKFQFVSGVQLDCDGNILIIDANMGCIQLFNDNLDYVSYVSTQQPLPYTSKFFVNNAGKMAVCDRNGAVIFYNLRSIPQPLAYQPPRGGGRQRGGRGGGGGGYTRGTPFGNRGGRM